LTAVQLEHILPFEDHRAAGRWRQAQDGTANRGLAAAGFAHQTQRLPFLHRERHAIHGFDLGDRALEDAAFDGKVFPQIFDLEQVFRLVPVRAHG